MPSFIIQAEEPPPRGYGITPKSGIKIKDKTTEGRLEIFHPLYS
jgi:hypothetical protein